MIESDSNAGRDSNDLENMGATAAAIDLETFSLELHTNFETEEEAIGLDLLNTLSKLAQQMNHNQLFYHNCRIS